MRNYIEIMSFSESEQANCMKRVLRTPKTALNHQDMLLFDSQKCCRPESNKANKAVQVVCTCSGSCVSQHLSVISSLKFDIFLEILSLYIHIIKR
jgi:hypothetical protein